MQFLKANTEVKVRIGPFVDVGDGFTPQTDIALSGDEAELLKHNGVVTVDISGNTWAAITNCRGWYDLTLTTTDTNTEGLLTVVVQDDSDCLPVFTHFMVIAQAAYDSIVVAKDTGYMDINVKAVSEDTTAADNLELALENGTAGYVASDVRYIEGADPTDTLETAVDAGLDNAIGGTPTADSVAERIKAMDLLTEANGAGDLAAILTDTSTTLDGVVDGIQNDLDNATDGLGALKTLIDAVPTATEIQTEMEADGASLLDTIRDELANATDGLGALKTLIDALPDTAAINAEVVDVLGTDTLSELSQGVPAATPTIKAALMLIYMALRNKLTTTSTELGIYNDAGTKIAKKTLSDDDTTYTETEMVSGA